MLHIGLCTVLCAALVAQAVPGPETCALRLVDGLSLASAIYCKTGASTKDPCFVVTAYHVVHKSSTVKVAFDPAAKVQYPLLDFVESKFVCIPEADLAVFRCTQKGRDALEKRRNARAINVGNKPVIRGTRVIAVGNPKITLFQGDPLQNEITPLNYVATGAVSDVDELAALLGDGAATGTAQKTPILFLETSQVEPGFSGGPVIDNSGAGGMQLIGMIQGGDPKNPKRSWAIPASEIARGIKAFDSAVAFPPPKWPTMLINSAAFKIPGKQDIRSYLNPSIVQRENYPERAISLTYQPGITLMKREPLVQGPRPRGDRENRQSIWEEWLYRGAVNKGVDIMVYKSTPFRNYYKALSGKIVFSGASDGAKLADCVGFLVSIDQNTGMEVLKQIDLSPGLKNMDAPRKKGLENDFKGLIIDPGDSIVVIGQFANLTQGERKQGIMAELRVK